MTSSSARDAVISPDGCPRCGGAVVPVLDGNPASGDGPILADPPVRLTCPACSTGSPA